MGHAATKIRATEIHLEPGHEAVHARFRIDGILQPSDPSSRQMGYAVINLFKVLHNMPKAGKTFASELRSILRQDPDVIMVGEIRDQETAEIACQAAQTGHIVFTTVHANDTVTALVRLVDLGVTPTSISSAVSAILGQR